VAQLCPQALGTHVSRLLRHAWVTVGLFFNPGHHTGVIIIFHHEFRLGWPVSAQHSRRLVVSSLVVQVVVFLLDDNLKVV
jgi:phosphoglucomutase